MRSYLILAGIVVLTILGDYALKYASLRASPHTSPWLFGGAALYALTALGWMWLMQSQSLAQIAVLYSSATILLLTGVGIVFFGETLSTRQVAGLAAALFAVVMMQADA
ncbi:hypothetical protein C8J30_1285 [Rhodobacter viridis]|uniref:Undecaprenyl phosphate-alpha-L-ara4N flippase subunit ArnF n=1 Tax=Rhodobacter viridis TaxID=1054202 RepID=A0A318TRF2_9RHOB|nr:transporter [Rhodobacter viridis]PYF06410.1 hypothetical protein C8J30_1285 [Rhodobacter viridis]